MQLPQISMLKKHRLFGRAQGGLPAFKPLHFHVFPIMKLETKLSVEI